jgi:2,3-bisphosphoglycerate-dependent phosphoglycerate mutase
VKTRDTKPALWFVRHGESTWNAVGLVQGDATGPVLTAKGRRQAVRVAESLADVTITAIHTSDLERARQTARIVGRALGVSPRSTRALRERNFGIAQGRLLRELDPAASGIEGDRVVDVEARPPGGESLSEMYERVGAFISERERDAANGDVLVVTHGGVIRIAQAYCAGVGVGDMTWGPVPNASVWGLGRFRPPVAVAP